MGSSFGRGSHLRALVHNTIGVLRTHAMRFGYNLSQRQKTRCPKALRGMSYADKTACPKGIRRFTPLSSSLFSFMRYD